MIYDDNSNNGNNGNKGKFSERLKKMRRDRLKKGEDNSLSDDSKFTIKDLGFNVLKVVLALPNMIYTNIKDSNNHKSMSNENNIGNSTKNNVDNDNKFSDDPLFNDVKIDDKNKRIKVNKIKEIDVSLLKKNIRLISRDRDMNNAFLTQDVFVNLHMEDRKVKLQKEIIDLIKKKLVKNINELEMLQSELYVLEQLENGDIYLLECQQDVKEIKKMLSKVKSLKEKYDFLKDNVDFEYMLEYGDDILIDKILELKEISTRDDIRHLIDDYKILDEYKFLYLKIDKLQEDVIKFGDYKDKKVEELKQRDIDFDKLKDNMYNVDRESDRYNNFVQKQELFFKELEEKMMHIESHERVTYRLKGFNQLLGNSFKYLGLLLVNPLKGLVPGIATQTIVTKNIISNLYNNLEWEHDKKMVYDSIDYSVSINAAINNLDDTSLMIDSTLEDIVKLKCMYEKEFSQYEGSFSSYKDAIRKLNKIENAVLGNKIKIEIMRNRMKEKEKQNNSKMQMVKKLNSSSN